MTDIDVSFSEVEPILDQLPQTWIGDSETNWYRYAWGLLKGEGATQADSDAGRNEVKLRAIALWAITKTFYVHAFSEGYVTDWSYEVGEALGTPPLLPRAWIVDRVLTEFDFSEHIKEYGEPPAHDELDTEVSMMLRHMVSDAADGLAATLSKSLGEAGTFASLWCSSPHGVDTPGYPLTVEAVADICGSPDEGRIAAYAWVSDDGMALTGQSDSY